MPGARRQVRTRPTRTRRRERRSLRTASPAARSPSAAVAAERSPASTTWAITSSRPGSDCTSGRASVEQRLDVAGSVERDEDSVSPDDRLRPCRGVERRVVREDRLLELLQLLARLQPELFVEQPPKRLEALERVGLPPRPVQGEHQLAVQPLAVRVLGDERLEVGDELIVPAEREVGLDALLEGDHPQLLQARDLRGGEILVSEIGQRRPAPERESLTELSGGHSAVRLRGRRRRAARSGRGRIRPRRPGAGSPASG